jgi:hypothetical protein
MNEELWNRWKQDREWVLCSMRQKGATIWCELEIAPPASWERVATLTGEHGIRLPDDFVEVLTGYSSCVTFHWSLDDGTGEDYVIRPPQPYQACTSGGGDWELWNIDTLLLWNQRQPLILRRLEQIEAEDVQNGLIDPKDPPERIWHNKTFFIHTPNGDYIAFDVNRGTENCPVVYLDHEWGNFNGARLGLTFVDFMTRWSNLGCPGVESWRMKPFYDPVQNLLMDSGEVVGNWKQWVSLDPRQGVLPLE